MKKGLLVLTVVGVLFGGVPAIEAAESREGISIAEGFNKLWKETGIYRFFNPTTLEEKEVAYRSALAKTVDAENFLLVILRGW